MKIKILVLSGILFVMLVTDSDKKTARNNDPKLNVDHAKKNIPEIEMRYKYVNGEQKKSILPNATIYGYKVCWPITSENFKRSKNENKHLTLK